jgi:hypothetical protein
MKAEDNSAAAASDPKRREDDPGLTAYATIHPHRSTRHPLRQQFVRCVTSRRSMCISFIQNRSLMPCGLEKKALRITR